MNTPILATKRLILRPLSIDDAEDIFERWTSDDRVSEYVRWCTHQNVEDTKQWLESEQKNNFSDTVYQWGFVLKETGYLFGCGGINFNEESGVYELGYNIMHKYWNQGYTTEAAKCILKFAEEELNINEFTATHDVSNPASGAVLKKCGFLYEKDGKSMKFDGKKEFSVRIYRLKSKEKSLLSGTHNTRKILPDSLKFIRSDVPAALSDTDIKWLTDNNILTIVDLRESRERKQKPCPLEHIDGFEYICMPVTGGNKIPESTELVPVSYLNMIDGQMVKIIEYMESAENNVLYFCNAGKDRTGVVSAILLNRLGYSKEYIIEDYMKSAWNLKNILEEFAKNNKDADINVITPQREYMENFLDNLHQNGGLK